MCRVDDRRGGGGFLVLAEGQVDARDERGIGAYIWWAREGGMADCCNTAGARM